MNPAAMLALPLPGESETLALGAALAAMARPGDVIALAGPLGAGKTTLARGFIRAFTGSEQDVVSPTFTLVQTYDGGGATVWHFDLYRLDHSDESLELGIEDAFANGISLIEWPDRLGAMMPRHRLMVTLSMSPDGTRTALLDGEAWAARLRTLKAPR